MKGCLDDHVTQRCKVKLEAATTVKELYQVLRDEENIFWPPQNCHKTFMSTKRKNSEDPLTYLTELRKKAKFCRISQIIDGQICNHCNSVVEIIEKKTQK